MVKYSVIVLLFSLLEGCSTFAPPSPLVTYGGPAVVDTGHSEVGLAVGTGFALFPGAHSGGQGWFGRYKRGVAENLDLGIDVVGVVRSDNGKGTLTAKVVGRYQVSERIRVEAGLGLADDSDGKSANGDVALTIGTVRETTWNYYASLRLGAAKGYPGSLFGTGDQIPPNALFPIVNLGTQARVAAGERFIFEGGFGYIIPEQEKAGPIIYLSCGLLFDI
ncbi:MAG TPA: hypothetical protein VLX91_10670 [Candidatus Acidoferrales bacterium]|nr:hypothetical protein [Candidatus Acidoferrales bacterium]